MPKPGNVAVIGAGVGVLSLAVADAGPSEALVAAADAAAWAMRRAKEQAANENALLLSAADCRGEMPIKRRA